MDTIYLLETRQHVMDVRFALGTISNYKFASITNRIQWWVSSETLVYYDESIRQMPCRPEGGRGGRTQGGWNERRVKVPELLTKWVSVSSSMFMAVVSTYELMLPSNDLHDPTSLTSWSHGTFRR